jgi:signal transduction histidine kinase
MRKLTKSTVLPAVLVLGAAALLVVRLALDMASDLAEDHIVQYDLSRLDSLNHSINEDVLRSRSFMLLSYDSIVTAAEQMHGTCKHLQGQAHLKVMSDSAFATALSAYCKAVEEKRAQTEAFKTSNSLFRNSIKYLPTLVAKYENSPGEKAVRKAFGEILLHAVNSDAEHSAQVEEQLSALEKTLKAHPVTQEFVRHSRIILEGWDKRKKVESQILSSDIEAMGDKLDTSYDDWFTLQTEKSRLWYGFWIMVCAAMAVGLVMLFKRLQWWAQNLEDKVTERTEQLRQSQQMLIQSTKITALGEMAGGIAHEINTPLGAIMLNAEMIRELADPEANAEMLPVVETIIRTVGRISKIIQGLRRFSRDSSNDDKTKAMVSDLVNETMNFCQEKIRAHDVTLSVNMAVDAKVSCVPEQISQVILNLVNNAYDAIGELKEREQKTITLETAIRGDRVELSVRNGGPPISKENQARLMQPFFTTKPVGKGVGLGLSISKGIIEEHGGKLFYDETAPSPRFVISLPYVAEDEDLGGLAA